MDNQFEREVKQLCDLIINTVEPREVHVIRKIEALALWISHTPEILNIDKHRSDSDG